jgi:CheY-like chemotaxis protein
LPSGCRSSYRGWSANEGKKQRFDHHTATRGGGEDGDMSATILIVDDHPVNLKLVSGVLEFEGYRVLKAADAEEAQTFLAKTRPDLILMDLALPGMDGLRLTRQLKADPATQAIRIVALTAFAMKGDEQKAPYRNVTESTLPDASEETPAAYA